MLWVGGIPGLTGMTKMESNLFSLTINTDGAGRKDDLAPFPDVAVRCAVIMLFTFDVHMTVASHR